VAGKANERGELPDQASVLQFLTSAAHMLAYGNKIRTHIIRVNWKKNVPMIVNRKRHYKGAVLSTLFRYFILMYQIKLETIYIK
jgi:hypothetical protein